MIKLSYTLESYLDAIYELSLGDGARLTDIAKRMGVTKSTASAAMTLLAEKNLITNERYRKIMLTDLGADLAEHVTQKHEIIKRFFCDVLCLQEEVADADACAVEHLLSADAVHAMRKLMEDNGL